MFLCFGRLFPRVQKKCITKKTKRVFLGQRSSFSKILQNSELLPHLVSEFRKPYYHLVNKVLVSPLHIPFLLDKSIGHRADISSLDIPLKYAFSFQSRIFCRYESNPISLQAHIFQSKSKSLVEYLWR